MKSALKIFGLIGLLVVSMLAIPFVSAATVPVQIQKVYVNNEEVVGNEVRILERASDLKVKVKLLGTGDDDYVTVEATIEGLEHDRDEATAKTDTFRILSGKTITKELEIHLPERMDAEEEYALRIEISNRKDEEVTYNAIIYVEPARHAIRIKDVLFSPDNYVKAGRALITNVRIKNIGEKDEESVKVTVSIPELGTSDSVYIDDLEEGDTKTSEDIWFRIPEDAQSGEYTVEVKVEFDDGDKEVVEEYAINVVGEEETETGKTLVVVSDIVQDITAGGSGVVYPITLSNTNKVSKTYTISANAGNWATIKVTPNVVVLAPGETKIVYVEVAANEDATPGEQVFGIAISSNEKVLKEITLKANVLKGAEQASIGLKTGLEIALIVLVVILIIIGLVIGFSRMKKSEPETEEQTYY